MRVADVEICVTFKALEEYYRDTLQSRFYTAIPLRDSRATPLAFVAAPVDDVFSEEERVREEIGRRPESVIIGAFHSVLIGAVGLYRDRLLKSSHKTHLWGLYVTQTYRRQGVASELLDAVLRHAATLPEVSWVHLKVSAATPGAQRLYERAGFRVWGTEPAGARYNGQTVADFHMAFCLEPNIG